MKITYPWNNENVLFYHFFRSSNSIVYWQNSWKGPLVGVKYVEWLESVWRCTVYFIHQRNENDCDFVILELSCSFSSVIRLKQNNICRFPSGSLAPLQAGMKFSSLVHRVSGFVPGMSWKPTYRRRETTPSTPMTLTSAPLDPPTSLLEGRRPLPLVFRPTPQP